MVRPELAIVIGTWRPRESLITIVPFDTVMVPLPLIVIVGKAESVISVGKVNGASSLLGPVQLVQVIPNTEFCDVNPSVRV